MTFFEGSARVPPMISAPNIKPRHEATPVSTIDVCPTLCDLAGVSMESIKPWTQGESLIPISNGVVRTSPVAMEYAAETSYAPLVSIQNGKFKYNQCKLDLEQLFDLENDPDEMNNLVGQPEYTKILSEFREMADQKRNLDRFDEEVRRSQARRWIVYDALKNGQYFPRDYQPLKQASERFMRNHMDLNEVEHKQMYPRSK